MLALSVAAMFIASLLAIFEQNVKRMLAYSSLGQIGYITLGISLANEAGLTGGIVHLFNHAVMKAALFLVLGAVAYRIGSVKLADLAGIGRQMPLTMAAFVVAGLAIIGTPGTAGFISKWYLAVGAFQKGWWPLVFLILASSMLAMVYIGRVVEVAWFREPSALAQKAKDPPLSMLVPVLLLAGRDDLLRLRYASLGRDCEPGRTRAARRDQMSLPFGPDTLMLLAIAIPFVAAALIPLFHRWPNLRELVTLSAAAMLAFVVWSLVGPVLDGARPERQVLEIVPGFVLAFAIEPLGMLFALVAGSLWLVNSIYSIGYMRANARAAPDLLLRLLCGRARRHHGDRVRQEPRHAVPVLRAADALDLSARRPQGQRGGRPCRQTLSRPAARFLHASVAAGDLRYLAACRHDRFQGRRHLCQPI